MRSVVKLALIAILTGVFLTVFAQNPPRNSYIDRRVTSVSDLVNHVKTDKDVMDRYQRHFAMSDAEVIGYLSTLHIEKLDKDRVFTVYGVPRSNGVIHTHLRLLKKGEPLLVESDGTPVLMLVCGNPLILGPQKPTMGNPVVATVSTPEPVRPTGAPDASPVPTPAAATPAVPGTEQPPTPTYQPPQEHHDNPLPLILGLAGSLGYFVTQTHHTTCVPEPMSMLVMVGGLAAVAARRRKARKS